MQATYDVRRPSVQPLAITFAVALSLILGGTGGFALKALTQAAVITAPAAVVGASLAGPVRASNAGAQMTRLELQDEQSQAQSSSGPAISQATEEHSSSRYGPR